MAKQIYGVLENCYNNFFVFRGCAEASILTRYSAPYEAYQRRPEDTHVKEIADFLRSGSNVYTPEIILSYPVGDWFDPEINPSFCGGMLHSGSVSPFDFLMYGSNFIDPDYLKAGRVILKDRNSITFSRLSSARIPIHLMKCSLPDSNIVPFRRIDGNHRLDAMNEIQGFRADYEVPFCIILLTDDLYSRSFDENKTAKVEMEIFHNINSKVRPLSASEQYRGLFNLFDARELERYGKEFSVTKAYLEKYSNMRFSNIANFFLDQGADILNCVSFMSSKGYRITEDDLADLLSKLEHTYFSDCHVIRSCKSKNAIVPYVYYCYKGGKQPNAKLAAYHSWFVKNRLYNVKDLDPASMIEVFDSIYELRKKQVFVAMPFKEELDFVFTAICDTIQKINRENGTELLPPIRIDKQIVGFSYDIVDEIFRNIENAGLLIADLTEENANVYYEAGYAQGLLRSNHGNTAEILYLISNPKNPGEPFSAAKFDVNHSKMIPYTNAGNGVDDLKAALEKELKAFYGI